jgi:hypothetical protein
MINNWVQKEKGFVLKNLKHNFKNMFGLVRTFKNDKNCKTKCNPIDYEY